LGRPGQSQIFTRLATFSRVILFDKRGTGLSDRSVGIAPLEERMDDVRAVMDAPGSERAALFGISEGGALSMLFAATYPERTRALVFYGTYARHPTLAPESLPNHMELIERYWGTGEYISRFTAQSKASHGNFRRSLARLKRQSASPAAVMAVLRMNAEIDARHILPTIQIPTLIMHRSGGARIPIHEGRYLAERVPGAKFIELPADDHYPFDGSGLVDRIADQIDDFLTGWRSSDVEVDRVLATVLFTDIVDSTKRAAALGDRPWRALLDATMRSSGNSWRAFAAMRSRTSATAFLPPSTGRRAPSAAVRPLPKPSSHSAWRCGADFTPERSN